ncbi:MAG: TlyA family RNA methyltransferase [Xanthobacteraceae bacterium]
MTSRDRADRLLVTRGLFKSRARAQAAIAAGRVIADGTVVRKASEEISPTAIIAAEPEHPYVSRGGVKLAAALDQFSLDVADRICLDVGASTGGFTQVLLERGAQCVYAVDVGRDQLHAQLRGHERILSIEQTDIRKLDSARLPVPVGFVVVDVSFISLKLVLPHLDRLTSPSATILALIKPQFEAERRDIKKGIVRDAAVHATIRNDIAAFMTTLGWRTGRLMESPILGGDGNREFFIEAARG